jgi:hypothetical protein
VGFALIYRPFMPAAFITAPGMSISAIDGFFSAINLSSPV